MSSDKVKYLTISWDEFHRDARTLSERLMKAYPNKFKGLIAITRGGLIPAAILARELGCRVVDTISVATYTHEAGTRGEPKVLKAPVDCGDGEGWLLVDDLVDSGVTAKFVRDMLPKAAFACLYAKPDGKDLTDYFIREVPQDTWILFPWDTAPSFAPPLSRDE
ncbi:xanthine phosphoribosyltransferase [Acetobacteraceae bacterium]|nr:xanthine phosphoribosyltransferase [Acetobacteraceae bacterium]